MAEKREETELYEENDEVDDPKTVEIRCIVVQELNRYNDKLSHALDQSLPKFASLMLGRQFISNYVYEKNPTFEAIVHDFKAGLNMLNLEELCDHCSRLLTVLIEVGGPCSQAAERLKRNWNKEVHKKCKITFLPYPQQEISHSVESCITSSHSRKSSQSDVQLSGCSSPSNVYNSPTGSATSLQRSPHNEYPRRFSTIVSTVSHHLKETTDQHFSYAKDILETTKEPGTTSEDMPLPPVQHFSPGHDRVVVSNTGSEIKSSRQTDPIDSGHRYSLQESSCLPSSYNEGMLRNYQTTDLQQQIDYLKLLGEISELKELQTKTARAQEKLKTKVQKQKKKIDTLEQELTIRDQDKSQHVVQTLIEWLNEQDTLLKTFIAEQKDYITKERDQRNQELERLEMLERQQNERYNQLKKLLSCTDTDIN